MAGIAVFDLDRTIVRFGSYSPFLMRHARRHAPWRLLLTPVVLLCMLGYKLKLIDRDGLKAIMFRLLVGSPSVAAFEAEAEAFAATWISRHCFQEALAAIAAHRAAGDRLILATASFEAYASAIGRRLGFDQVIGTRLKTESGRYLPELDGPNCYAGEKLRRVTAALGDPLPAFTFYTDDKSDIPLLERAAAGVLVNPRQTLRDWAAGKPAMTIVHWG